MRAVREVRDLMRWLRQRATSARSERGGALVEFGLVIPIFLTVVLGSVTTGMSYNTNNSLNNGAREIGRYAATLSIDGDLPGYLTAVADGVEEATNGAMGPNVASREICIAYVHPDGTEDDDRTMLLLRNADGTVIADGVGCFDDARPAGERRVQISLSREHEIQAVVYDSIVELEATTVVRYERAE